MKCMVSFADRLPSIPHALITSTVTVMRCVVWMWHHVVETFLFLIVPYVIHILSFDPTDGRTHVLALWWFVGFYQSLSYHFGNQTSWNIQFGGHVSCSGKQSCSCHLSLYLVSWHYRKWCISAKLRIIVCIIVVDSRLMLAISSCTLSLFFNDYCIGIISFH